MEEKEKLATLAPGRLSRLLAEGLRGHHLLFEHAAILAAFEAPDAPVAREDANAVGHALLTICKEPLPVARAAVGPRLVLWGCIPQDVLLPSCSDAEFRSSAADAFDQAGGDPAAVVGVADRVPVEAVPARLLRLAEMARGIR